MQNSKSNKYIHTYTQTYFFGYMLYINSSSTLKTLDVKRYKDDAYM